ncbi:uncharacterized protein TNCV_4253831 [Trichonephila clavipes]|nr:uncharacterized protein TNCV_4253831 [Trichonephila clavipes]
MTPRNKRACCSKNDIPIDVACHRYTLNMQVCSRTKNISSPNEPSCSTVTVPFNGVLLVITRVPGALHIKVRRESDCKQNLDSSENITQDHCCGVHNACSRFQGGAIKIMSENWIASRKSLRTTALIARNSALSRENKLLIYKLILRPILTYAAPIWVHAARSYINQIEVSQSIILRQILNDRWFMRT